MAQISMGLLGKGENGLLLVTLVNCSLYFPTFMRKILHKLVVSVNIILEACFTVIQHTLWN